MKRRNGSLSIVTADRQNEKLKRISSEEERITVGSKSLEKLGNDIEAKPVGSGALRLEGEPAF